jgi:hypothetical protein
VIEDGAYFKGSIDIIRPDTSKAQAQQQTPRQQTMTAAASPAAQPAPQISEVKR